MENVKVENPEAEKKENEIRPIDHVKDKKRNKDEKGRRKDDVRTDERFLKLLNNVQSVEEKLEITYQKNCEIREENRKLQSMLNQTDKKMLLLQREVEQFQNERSKSILTRRRLESLCRELQKQNKAIKAESLLKIREEEEKRKEVSAKFRSTLAEITALMNQNIEKNAKMHEDNLDMNKKFKSVYEQVEQKEQQLLKVHQQMKLDLQLAHTELAKVRMEAKADKEALLKEKQQLLFKLTEYQVQIRELQATEIGLRSQISMYTDKYDEFQNALTRSNKVYGEFNEEMEKMSKKILTREKESSLWKQRWENSHAALLEMAADKQIRDAEMATLSKKLSLLQDLCKMFQRERTSLLAQLKEKNGTLQTENVSSNASDITETSQTDDTAQMIESAQSIEGAEVKSEEGPECYKQANKLSQDCLKLQSTFDQLQASLSKVSDAIQKGLDEESPADASRTQNDNSKTAEDVETGIESVNTSHNNLGDIDKKSSVESDTTVQHRLDNLNQEKTEKSQESIDIVNVLDEIGTMQFPLVDSESSEIVIEASDSSKDCTKLNPGIINIETDQVIKEVALDVECKNGSDCESSTESGIMVEEVVSADSRNSVSEINSKTSENEQLTREEKCGSKENINQVAITTVENTSEDAELNTSIHDASNQQSSTEHLDQSSKVTENGDEGSHNRLQDTNIEHDHVDKKTQGDTCCDKSKCVVNSSTVSDTSSDVTNGETCSNNESMSIEASQISTDEVTETSGNASKAITSLSVEEETLKEAVSDAKSISAGHRADTKSSTPAPAKNSRRKKK